MAKKFYAVIKDDIKEIFTDWETCSAYIKGEKGVKYKGFMSREDAEAFLRGEDTQAKTPKPDEGCAIAYVDGSFNADTNEYSYGVVLFKGDEVLEFSGKDNNKTAVSMRNVAGELKGAMFVMQYCVRNGIKGLVIHHDYEGIGKWYNGQWKTNTSGTEVYKRFCDGIRQRLDVSFVKVKGHSGDKFNDRADKLAKEALGIS